MSYQMVEVPKHTEIEGLKSNKEFRTLVNRGIAITKKIKELEEELADVKENIEVELITSEVTGTVDYNGWKVCVVDKEGTSRIDKKKLLRILGDDGVRIMKEATVTGKPSHYVMLRPPGEKNEDE